ncbi:MAG: tetratricopeptide repeat protein [Leuconostoc mesenteroides]
MMTTQDNILLKTAIKMRHEKEFKASNRILKKLDAKYPLNANIQYQYAWSFDILGQEREAVPHYYGLGSTLRSIGSYDESLDILSKGTELFPTNNALKVFKGMTLYNLKRFKESSTILLQCLIELIQVKTLILNHMLRR